MCEEVRKGVVEHYGMLRKFALKLNSANADDIVQETIERALRHEDTFEPGSNIKAWLARIERNVFLNRLRDASRRKCVSLEDQTPENLPGIEAPQEWAVLLRDLSRVWANPKLLKPKHRAALEAIALEGLEYQEASAMLGIPEGTLKSRAARGRFELAKALG